MNDFEKEVEELFSNMSDEEFEQMLIDSGFEIEEGEGKIIYEEDDPLFNGNGYSGMLRKKITTTFKMKQTTFTTNYKEENNKFYYLLRNAC